MFNGNASTKSFISAFLLQKTPFAQYNFNFIKSFYYNFKVSTNAEDAQEYLQHDSFICAFENLF